MNLFSILEASLLQLTSDVRLFLESPASSCFLANTDIDAKLELRKSHHHLDYTTYPTLDITAITVGVSFKSMGVGTKLIKIIKDSNPYPATFLYNVVDEALCAYLLRRNWKKANGTTNLYILSKDISADPMKFGVGTYG